MIPPIEDAIAVQFRDHVVRQLRLFAPAGEVGPTADLALEAAQAALAAAADRLDGCGNLHRTVAATGPCASILLAHLQHVIKALESFAQTHGMPVMQSKCEFQP